MSTSTAELHEDRALLDAFRRGERAALARVFARYADDVARTVRSGVVVDVDGQRVRLGGGVPEHDVEVLIQETFLRAFAESARNAYDGLRPFGAYLATIARNLVVDRGRRQLRDARKLTPLERADDVADDTTTDPSWPIEEQQLRAILEAMKARLPADERAIFACRFEQQLSIRATADALGLTVIVVRRRDTRIRAQLLAVLREHGYLETARVRIGATLLERRSKKNDSERGVKTD